MNPLHIAILLALASPLAACDGLAALEKKPSPFRANQERLAAITLPASATTVIEAVADVPVVQVQTCTENFRINRCDGNTVMPWEY